VFADDLHAKRILSLANGTLGVMTGAALAVSLIGHALAHARGLVSKSAIKQVDRLLSNPGVVPWDLFGSWVGEVVGARREIVVATDWTDFDADNQATFTSARPTAKRGWPPDWVGKHGRARKLRDAKVSAARQKVGAVVCVKAVGMKEAWHLATSDASLSAPQIIKLYSKRWTIEPSFRDSKDMRFGMGLGALRIDDPRRRDRLLLLNAFASLLLTILGAAGESLGMDRQLRTSTAKRRVHSLFRQGCLLYDLIPSMPEERLRPLVERYAQLIRQNATFTGAFGIT
jgi:hypothetical protein